MGELFNQCSYLSENEFVRLDSQMTCFADYLGAMERIFKSPIPLPYTRCVSGPELQRMAVQTRFARLQAQASWGIGCIAHALLACRWFERDAEVCNGIALVCLMSCMPSPEVHSPLCGLAWRLACRVPQISGMLSPCLLPTLVCWQPCCTCCRVRLLLSLVIPLQAHLPFPDDLACPDALWPVVWLPLAHGAGVRYHRIPPSWNR